MLDYKKITYAVFGNPIHHSQSPMIHNFFFKEVGLSGFYQAIHVPLKQFSSVILDFFKYHGKGANVTAPFKKEAFYLSNTLTERAKIAKSVNTLKKTQNNEILGDNTDGIGLFEDLKRLNFIEKDCSVLIIGAGGAVQGILYPILSFGCSVFILNRTSINAEKLISQFRKYGCIHILKKELCYKKHFDLIINATSRNITENYNFFPVSLISDKTYYYDINYSISDTPFLKWCKKLGAIHVSDGIGMLALQAAYSFFLWHKVLPDTHKIISILKNNN